MRLDHLLSQDEKRSRGYFAVELSGRLPEEGRNGRQRKDNEKDAGGDALMGNTRTHPEHDG